MEVTPLAALITYYLHSETAGAHAPRSPPSSNVCSDHCSVSGSLVGTSALEPMLSFFRPAHHYLWGCMHSCNAFQARNTNPALSASISSCDAEASVVEPKQQGVSTGAARSHSKKRKRSRASPLGANRGSRSKTSAKPKTTGRRRLGCRRARRAVCCCRTSGCRSRARRGRRRSAAYTLSSASPPPTRPS